MQLSSRIIHEDAGQMEDTTDREIETLEETAGTETAHDLFIINRYARQQLRLFKVNCIGVGIG